MNKILIIGGAGFIGHNLALRFKSLKYNVGIIDSLAINNYLSISEKNKDENTSVTNKDLEGSILDKIKTD